MNSISEFVEWLTQNPWIILIIFIIGIISPIISIILYIKSKREKKPFYAIRSTNIVQDFSSKFESLELRYSAKRIENLTVSKFLFWNGGNQTISMQDVAEAEPLQIVTEDNIQILDAKVIQIINSANGFQVSIADDRLKVPIYFDYIDKNEGCVIQLIHTGKSSKDLKFNGKIKGFGSPEDRSFSGNSLIFENFFFLRFKKILSSKKRIRYLFFITTIMYASFFLGLGIQILLESLDSYFHTLPSIFLFLVSGIWLLSGIKFIRRLPPSEFNSFDEDL